MKKLITCASLAAVGAMTVDAQPIGDPSKSKLWSVSAKLRGFYDDNYNTGPDQSSAGLRPAKADSWGISFAPSVGFNVIKEMTTFNAQVDYQLRWFEARTDNQIDHMVLANLELFHDFSENYRLELKDRFAYSDEPTVLEPLESGRAEETGTVSGLSRVFGDRVVSEKPLDEVVLDYLVENARKRKRGPR